MTIRNAADSQITFNFEFRKFIEFKGLVEFGDERAGKNRDTGATNTAEPVNAINGAQ